MRAVLKRLQLQGRRQQRLDVTSAGAKLLLGGLLGRHKAVTFQWQLSADVKKGLWLDMMSF